MLNQLQPESNIPSRIYELAASHGVGAPLRKQRRLLLQIVLVLEILVGLGLLGWIGYAIYGSVVFNILSHTYSNINSVPDNQLDTYLWSSDLHTNFWLYMLQALAPLMALLGHSLPFFSAYRTKLYVCTEGLLKITRNKSEGVRWDEVKELYLPNGTITRLVKYEGDDVYLPPLLMSGRKNALNILLRDEVMRCLLPGMLASYERGETITFGDLRVNQKGISRPGNMVYWRQIGDITLEKQILQVYYSELERGRESSASASIAFAGKWHTWRKSVMTSASWPNLPIFVALVNTILDQRGANQREAPLLAPQPPTLKEMAALARRQNRRRKRVTIATISISALIVLALIVGIPVYQSVQEQQRAERDTQLLQNHFRQLARQPYAVHVPGEHCGNGKNFWLDDDAKNTYRCQSDGLLMTLNDHPYADAEWFTLVPDTLSTIDTYSSVDYFPHHYRVQVQANVLSENQDVCIGIGTHEQNYMEDQSFDVCTDGNWFFYRCDAHCPPETYITSGALARANQSYLIAVEVTDSVLSLSVDQKPVASVHDATYHSTDQIELKFYSVQNETEPVQTLFSDFAYTLLQ